MTGGPHTDYSVTCIAVTQLTTTVPHAGSVSSITLSHLDNRLADVPQ